MPPRLNDFKVLTFDCYGTLIDWETGMWDALQPLFARNPGPEIEKARALAAFGRIEKQIESASPGMIYTDVLARTHARLARELGLESTAELDRSFGSSIANWPAFSDTAPALRFLKSRYQLVVLSNVSRAGFASSNPKLGVTFDAVYTAEDIGSYKPSPRNFEYMLTRLREDHGLEKDAVLHTAQSLFHDHAPAKSFGLATAWIDRQRLSQGGSWGATTSVANRPEPDFLFFSMGEMAEAVRAEADTKA